MKDIDRRVAEAAKDCGYAPVTNALMCLHGTGSYVGLVPGEQSSGQSRNLGPITKAGSKYAREKRSVAANTYKSHVKLPAGAGPLPHPAARGLHGRGPTERAFRSEAAVTWQHFGAHS